MLATRISTEDAASANSAETSKSVYFDIQSIQSAAGNAKDKEIINSILSSLTRLNNKTGSDSEINDYKKSIAIDLINSLKNISPNLALNILIETSRHPIFLKSLAHEIIIQAIRTENLHRDKLVVSNHTLSFIVEYRKSHPHAVENFLGNPDLLLMWINLADTLEVSRLFREFFQFNSPYYLRMKSIAEHEIKTKNYGKGVICFALMYTARLTAEDISCIHLASNWLKKYDLANEYSRIIKSLQIITHPVLENINDAANCYINTGKIDLVAAKFSCTSFRGANLNNSILEHASFNGIDMTGVVLDDATLTGANMQEISLSHGSFKKAKMTYCNLNGSNLNHTDFSGADLSFASLANASLTAAIFDNTILEDTEFIGKNKILNTVELELELNRLERMLKDHRNEARLRMTIIKNIVRAVHSDEFTTADAIAALKVAHRHPICQYQKELEAIKSGIDYSIQYAKSFYVNWMFGTTSRPPEKLSYETSDEKTLRMEIEKLEARLKSESRPPPPPYLPH
ncbi:MAG TPA: pentapeptide repeat-containing protein [Gammaproteobacteria bacterium]|nr:pentapeptide repeat-containing protein [Gammaproteobacteria bacterium]